MKMYLIMIILQILHRELCIVGSGAVHKLHHHIRCMVQFDDGNLHSIIFLVVVHYRATDGLRKKLDHFRDLGRSPRHLTYSKSTTCQRVQSGMS